MRIRVYPYKVYDITKDTSTIVHRLATREHIERIGQELVNVGMRGIDESLVDAEGRIALDLVSQHASTDFLARLYAANGHRLQTSGNINRAPMHALVEAGLAVQEVIGVDLVEYTITNLGRQFVIDLLT